jgi:predicted RND superfamily exporter protein
MARLNWINLALVLAAILVCCAVVFRSPAAGLLFAVACVMANFGAFLYMNALTMRPETSHRLLPAAHA